MRENNFRTGPTVLSGAPSTGDFRVTLRIYEPRATNTHTVRVTAFTIPINNEPVLEASIFVPIRGGSDSQALPEELRDYPSQPAMGEITAVAEALPVVLASPRFGIRIDPTDDSLEYWPMLSITHNDTQRITIIAPQ